MDEKELLEKLSDLEHQQWEYWSKAVAKELDEIFSILATDFNPGAVKARRIITDRLERWNKYWVPYAELSEEIKEYDRERGKKVIKILKENGTIK